MLRIVILTLLCIFVCCAFAGDSYKESKPGNEKRKSDEVSGSYRVTKHRRKQSHSRTRKKTAYNYSDPAGTAFQKRSKEMLRGVAKGGPGVPVNSPW